MEAVQIEFDQPRELRLDLKAAKALDRAIGEVGLGEVQRRLQSFNIDALEKTLWAALQHEDPTLTLSLTSRRLEAFYQAHGSLYPLFLGAIRALDKSGLFEVPDESPNGTAATSTK